MVVGVMGLGVGAGSVVINGVQSSTINVKLAEDVNQMNLAIQIYQTGGGSLAGITDPGAVLSKLKSVTTTANNKDREVMFVKRAMIDQRLEVVPHSTAPGKFWNFARKFVRYVPAKARFEVADAAAGDTFLGFQYNDAIANAAPAEDVRNVTWKQAKVDAWVWDYDPTVATSDIVSPEEINVTTVNPPGIPAAGAIAQAAPPTALPAPPQLALASYPLNVQLLNSNPADVSRIIFVPPGGGSTGEWYQHDFVVHPGGVVSAYVDSLDESLLTDSANAIFSYIPNPEQLIFLDTVPAAYSYVDLGGALAPGSPPADPVAPPTIQLNTGTAIPDVYQNSTSFLVYKTTDGTDPATSGTKVPTPDFFGGFPGDTVPLSLAAFGAGTQATVRYVGISTSPELFINSASVSRTVAARKLTLRSPLLSPTPGVMDGSAVVSLDLDLSGSDMPPNTRIFYRVDGADPGDVSGEPGFAATLYTGPFTVAADPGDAVTVMARVYPPIDAKNWFDTSLSASGIYTNGALPMLYYGVNGTTTIYTVDPVTGATAVLNSSAPYPLASIAYDPDASYLYYLESEGNDAAKLGRYDLKTSTHVDFGRLIGRTGFPYKIAKNSGSLEFWKGSLYLVPDNSDDLVQVQLATYGITNIKKLLDFPAHNNKDFMCSAVTPDGSFFYSSKSDLYKVNLSTLSGSAMVRSNMDEMRGLLYNPDTGKLHGNTKSPNTRIDSYALSNGAGVNGPTTSPAIPFTGLAQPSGYQPGETKVPAALYACLGGNAQIYTVNARNGTNALYDAGASFNIGALAYDDLDGVIYYLEQAAAGVPWRLGKLNVAGVHSILGSIRTGWTYNPATLPQNLVAVGGHLYYITPGTDDLVRVDLLAGGTGIAQQTRVADITGNATTFANPGDLALTREGTVFFVNQGATNRLYRYNLMTTGSYLDIGPTTAPYPALACIDGAIYGARGSITTIDRLILNSGEFEVPVTTSPTRMFVDFASSVPAAASVPSDSLWAIREESGRARLVEFVNYKNQSNNVVAVDWGEIFHEDGASYKSFSAGGATTGITGLALTDGGEGYLASNRSLIAGGVTYLRPLLQFEVPAIQGNRIVATVLGDMKTQLQTILGAAPSATDRVTGLGISPEDDELYAVLDRTTGSATDRLLKLETFEKDGQEQLNTITNLGPLTGSGQTAEKTEDLAFDRNGVLYIADTDDDRIYTANPATGAILSTYSTQTNSHYAGLAMHPINSDLVGSTTAGGLNNQSMRITSGTSNDTSFFNYQTRFGLTGIQAMAFFAFPLDDVPGPPPPPFQGPLDVDTAGQYYPFNQGHTHGHVHAYDRRSNGAGGANGPQVNFFNLQSPGNKLRNINQSITNPATKFKIIVVNPNLSDAGRISVNKIYDPSSASTYTKVKDYTSTSLALLPTYSLGGVAGTTQLTQLSMNFPYDAASGGLVATHNGPVKKNRPGKFGEYRNGALVVQAVLVNPDGTNGFTTNPAISNGGQHGAGTSGVLWEALMYLHAHGPSYDKQ